MELLKNVFKQDWMIFARASRRGKTSLVRLVTSLSIPLSCTYSIFFAVKANLASEESIRMSSREVYAQVSSIMLAGEETVSDALLP